jgi:hypothetical protein
MKKRIYTIPGLGVDERLFSKLRIDDAELIPVKWIEPEKNETLPAYAGRLAAQIDTSRPFYLMGVSFGGMCSLELGKVLKPVKIILISSAKGQSDLPWHFKILRFIPMHKMMSDRFSIWMALHHKWLFGIKGKEQAALFEDMLNRAPKNYPARAIDCIVTWRNTESPENLVHIHGTGDRIILSGNVKDFIPVRKGSHMMVMNNAEEVSRIVNDVLNK